MGYSKPPTYEEMKEVYLTAMDTAYDQLEMAIEMYGAESLEVDWYRLEFRRAKIEMDNWLRRNYPYVAGGTVFTAKPVERRV